VSSIVFSAVLREVNGSVYYLFTAPVKAKNLSESEKLPARVTKGESFNVLFFCLHTARD